MAIHCLHPTHTRGAPSATLAAGEVPMPYAPSVELPNGTSCIPQHYLRYHQTPHTISAIVADLHFDNHTPMFAGEDDHGMYVQVGLLGRENYDRAPTVRPLKLVYGRKWRIDADTPTSEIIQTAFLAIKKVREHEVREMLTIRDSASGKVSTPFSSHIDLPLMARNTGLVSAPDRHAHVAHTDRMVNFLEPVRFGERQIAVLDVVPRPLGVTLVDLKLGTLPLARQAEGDLPEFNDLHFTVMLKAVTQSELLHEIMAAMVAHSDRQVDERFTYQGFARFSRANDPLRIAQLSIATRPYARDAANTQFTPVFRAMNYAVDASRAPSLGLGSLAQKNHRMIDAHGPRLAGHMPQGYEPPAQVARA